MKGGQVDLLLNRVVQRLGELVVPRHSILGPDVAQALAPGKLFRPQLALRVSDALGLPEPVAASEAAVAVELLHMSSLVHDDVMDDAPQRRGVPTVHTVADPATAIAIGNLLLARAASVAASLGVACTRTFAGALECLWEGQLMESAVRERNSRSNHGRYIALKTAALMAATCEMAALSQRADERQSSRLARFGHEVGMAFQVADDLLDHIGERAVLGKAVGTDTSRGIVSLGAWHALELRGETPETLSAQEINSLAAEDEPVRHALKLVGAHLDGARRTLSGAGVDASALWRHPRTQIAGMLIAGVREDRRELVHAEVARWPE
jgi:heptaprenyl diphosphate synthase